MNYYIYDISSYAASLGIIYADSEICNEDLFICELYVESSLPGVPIEAMLNYFTSICAILGLPS